MNATHALSLHQPWAWLIIRPDLGGAERIAALAAGDLKDVENRNCPLDRFPGRPSGMQVPFRIYVHAAQAFDQSAPGWLAQHFPHIHLPDRFDHGGLVGRVTITGCVKASPSRWFMGLYGFTLTDAEAIPYRRLSGQQGFFRVPGIGIDDRQPMLL